MSDTFEKQAMTLIAVLKGETPVARRQAEKDLLRMARELDRLKATTGTAFDAEDTPIDDE